MLLMRTGVGENNNGNLRSRYEYAVLPTSFDKKS